MHMLDIKSMDRILRFRIFLLTE